MGKPKAQFLTGRQLAAMAGVSGPAVSKNLSLRAVRVKGLYPIDNRVVKAFVEGERAVIKLQREAIKKKKSVTNAVLEDNVRLLPENVLTLNENIFADELERIKQIRDPVARLEAQKALEDMALVRERRISAQAKNAKEAQDIVPKELISVWVSAFANGIRNNFLHIPERIARGDVTLKDRIAKEITKAIDKTIADAAHELKGASGGFLAKIVKGD